MSRILLVADSDELARVIRRELEAAGYRVTLARDGEEALQRYDQVEPTLLILDWMIPKVDRVEVLFACDREPRPRF